MGISANRHGEALHWLLMALMVMAGVMAGCATARTGSPSGPTVRTIWQGREQFVRVEKQDHPAGVTVPVNDHPPDISADRLRTLLESIEVRFPDSDKTVLLFNDEELKILSENIRAGLASAGPDEDVTFAVIGHHAVLMGIFKQRMVTTGRVFCQGGKVNIIFGEILREVKDNEDRRLYPFLQGSRIEGAPRAFTLAVQPGRENFAMKRPDWVIFPVAGPAVPAAAPAAPQGRVTEPAAPAEPREKAAPAGRKTVEERLMTLNELRNKKLISEEEYRAKRLEILNEL